MAAENGGRQTYRRQRAENINDSCRASMPSSPALQVTSVYSGVEATTVPGSASGGGGDGGAAMGAFLLVRTISRSSGTAPAVVVVLPWKMSTSEPFATRNAPAATATRQRAAARASTSARSYR
jgi:hypothetical protein